MATSAEGSFALAATSGGGYYRSTDSETTWQRQDGMASGTVYLAARKVDSLLAAAVTDGQLYTRRLKPATGAGGALYGNQWDAVELQYLGEGRFMIRSYDGDLVFY